MTCLTSLANTTGQNDGDPIGCIRWALFDPQGCVLNLTDLPWLKAGSTQGPQWSKDRQVILLAVAGNMD